MTFSSCTITGNAADSGGGVYILSGTVSFLSCTVTGNTAYNNPGGGGVFVGGGTVTFDSCTIGTVTTGNTATYMGGGVYVTRGTVTFSSCTITGNTANIVRAHPQNFLGMRAYVQKFPWGALLCDLHVPLLPSPRPGAQRLCL